jgi:hypothetical protein
MGKRETNITTISSTASAAAATPGEGCRTLPITTRPSTSTTIISYTTEGERQSSSPAASTISNNTHFNSETEPNAHTYTTTPFNTAAASTYLKGSRAGPSRQRFNA